MKLFTQTESFLGAKSPANSMSHQDLAAHARELLGQVENNPKAMDERTLRVANTAATLALYELIKEQASSNPLIGRMDQR